MKYSFPSNYGEHTYLVPIDAALVPIIAGTMRKFFDRGVWESGDDYEAGYNAFAQLLANMATVTLSDLVESNRQIYRLLDAALNGTAYSASTDQAGATTVTPAIPAAPANEVGAAPGLRRQLLDMQGVTGAGWFGIGGRPATLADVIRSAAINTTQDQGVINNAVEEVLLATSSGASIAQVVSNVLAGAADVAGDGGLAAVTIAASLAQSITAATMINQLTRIITALDGGQPSIVTPDDNILQALRGNTPASGSRNVIDSANSQTLAALLDQVEPLLAEIRDKVQ